MTVGTIGVQTEAPQISKKEKKEQAVQRVKTEFLRQVQEGVSEKEAFKNSLKAIDEKYNPQADKFQSTTNDAVGCSQPQYLCAKAFKMPKLDPEDVKVWLEIIEKAIPVVLSCVTAIENFVDWLIEHKAPQTGENCAQKINTSNLQTAKYSTTA
ncbi:MAG: hypothetical protein IJY61_00680 [Candidatus Gastranaerophilales bacterium]|nr:hypothetical protein [Candidatus Gastranaerophilales bacterium]